MIVRVERSCQIRRGLRRINLATSIRRASGEPRYGAAHLFWVQIHTLISRHMLRQRKDTESLPHSRLYHIFQCVFGMQAELPRVTMMRERHASRCSTGETGVVPTDPDRAQLVSSNINSRDILQ